MFFYSPVRIFTEVLIGFRFGVSRISIDIDFNCRIGAYLRAVFRILLKHGARLVVFIIFFGYFDIVVKEALL